MTKKEVTNLTADSRWRQRLSRSSGHQQSNDRKSSSNLPALNAAKLVVSQ